MIKKGIALMADYVFLSKYAQKKEDGSLEMWPDTVQRIYSMHEKKLKSMNKYTEKVQMTLKKAQHSEEGKLLLSSQRARQFASSNENSGILKHETKIYNCTDTLVDRPKVFSEVMYLLLSGCGVGYSLHKPSVEKLPEVPKLNHLNVKNFTIPDSIEGWADSVDVLVNARFSGQEVEFDYSQIRPEGALIDNKFVATGPEPLKKAHQNIKAVFSAAQGRKLRTIELHDILCFIAEDIVSGGVRRSAMISLFDRDDEDMLKAKTGNNQNKFCGSGSQNDTMFFQLRNSGIVFQRMNSLLIDPYNGYDIRCPCFYGGGIILYGMEHNGIHYILAVNAEQFGSTTGRNNWDRDTIITKTELYFE